MSHRMRLVAVCLTCGIALSVSSLPAAGKKAAPKTDPGLADVEKVLRAEVAGPVDRQTQLAATLWVHPDSGAARWQSGFLRVQNEWRRYDEAGGAADNNPNLVQYGEQRKATPDDAPAQLELADWCRTHQLPDQERAHLYRALELGSGAADAVVLERLGYARISGQWLSPEQFIEWRGSNRKAEESLGRWEPRISRLADRLSGPRNQRAAALDSVKKTVDPTAIPAIEYLIAGESEELGLVAVELLRQIDGYEAALALARQAVFSPWRPARDAAREGLRRRPLDQFVPDLLGLLATPVTAERRFFVRPERPGVLYYSLVMSRETENQFQVRVLTTADQTLANQVEYNIGLRTGIVIVRQGVPRAEVPRFRNDWSRLIRDSQRSRDEEIIRENERTAEMNQRVAQVLKATAGTDVPATPQEWWKWWAGVSDVESPGSKPVVVVNEEETASYTSGPRITYRPSCFAAGTAVWTETGMVAIERVQVGDRVVAKNIETGAVELKPVLKTTVRPPKELTTLRFSDETIVCTGGHRFWVSGQGWIKARDLTDQTMLHTVTGNTPVWTAKKGETAETYNLVVADFHTYFVGKAGLLCQDLLPPQRTNNIVPGLARKDAVAQTSK